MTGCASQVRVDYAAILGKKHGNYTKISTTTGGINAAKMHLTKNLIAFLFGLDTRFRLHGF